MAPTPRAYQTPSVCMTVGGLAKEPADKRIMINVGAGLMGSNLFDLPYLRGHIDSSFADEYWHSRETPDGLEKYAIWFLGDQPDGPAMICLSSPPNPRGEKSPAHSHAADQIRLIVEGSFRVGAKWYRAGEMRIQEAGRVYGPEVVGPEGCKQVIIFSRRSGMVMDMAREDDRAKFAPVNRKLSDIIALHGGVGDRVDSVAAT